MGSEHVESVALTIRQRGMKGTNSMSEDTGLVVISSPLGLISSLTAEKIQADFAPTREWRYSFQQKGATIQGLSSDGVQDGVRQMARKGEAIRCLDVRLEKDDIEYAYFVAHAARYAISADGQEILLDSTIRGKRVSKHNNEFWFEQGLTKAARNAEEALLPEALKQWMLAQSAQLEKPQGSPTVYRNGHPAVDGKMEGSTPSGSATPSAQTAPTKPQEARQLPQSPRQASAFVRPDNDCEHEATVSDDGRTVCKKCGFLL